MTVEEKHDKKKGFAIGRKVHYKFGQVCRSTWHELVQTVPIHDQHSLPLILSLLQSIPPSCQHQNHRQGQAFYDPGHHKKFFDEVANLD